ncbi:SRPBCC domain-containing protein [Planococcus rifietoensis]|uniref:SRPBCC domain-containing protein n=1 Tax=Planococcus rifietoensis TaxID=200991 RepID=UPI003850E1EE
MTAEITKNPTGYNATFDRYFEHSPEQVWAMLTDNHKIHRWFSGLQMEEEGEPGHLTLEMGHGKKKEFPITDYKKGEILAFEWGDDHVHFELGPDGQGTRVKMVETLPDITDQTPKDVAGWHVALDIMEAILDGHGIERTSEWERWYPEYKRLFESMGVDFA